MKFQLEAVREERSKHREDWAIAPVTTAATTRLGAINWDVVPSRLNVETSDRVDIAEALKEALGFKAVAIWSCSELECILTLQGLDPSPSRQDPELPVAFELIDGPLENGRKSGSAAHAAIRRALNASEATAHF